MAENHEKWWISLEKIGGMRYRYTLRENFTQLHGKSPCLITVNQIIQKWEMFHSQVKFPENNSLSLEIPLFFVYPPVIEPGNPPWAEDIPSDFHIKSLSFLVQPPFSLKKMCLLVKRPCFCVKQSCLHLCWLNPKLCQKTPNFSWKDHPFWSRLVNTQVKMSYLYRLGVEIIVTFLCKITTWNTPQAIYTIAILNYQVSGTVAIQAISNHQLLLVVIVLLTTTWILQPVNM